MIWMWYERIFISENIRMYSKIRIFVTPWSKIVTGGAQNDLFGKCPETGKQQNLLVGPKSWRTGGHLVEITKSPCFRATSHENHQWWRQNGARRGHWTKAKVTGRWWGRRRQGEGVKEGERRRRRWLRGWQEQCKGKGQQQGQCCHLHLSRGWVRVELLAQTSSSTLQGV